MNWNFNAVEGQEEMGKGFATIPVGDYRIRFATIEETTSSKGKDMLKITFDVSGYGSKIFHYLVFDGSTEEARKRTNGNLAKIYDSFGITVGDMNFKTWIGKVGACRVKHEMYENEPQAKVSYFILKSKQQTLPAWKESGTQNPTVATPVTDDLAF